MESSESHEPSYYEVALTNRQVVGAFVVILVTLMGAFLSGVWIGRGSSGPRVASRPQPAAAEAEEPVEQLTFFGDKEPGARERGPAAEPAAAAAGEDSATEAMRKTLEAEMAANRETGEPAPEAAETEPAPTPERVESAAGEVAREPGSRTRRRPRESAETPVVPAEAEAPAAGKSEEPASESAAPGESSGTWVQVYSSTNGERAREIAGMLRRAGFSVVVAELPREGQTNWRVRVGPYATRDEADAAAGRLRREHRLDTWVTDSP